MSETQQHDRYETALKIKEMKINSEVLKSEAELTALKQKTDVEAAVERECGHLQRHLDSTLIRQKIAGLTTGFGSVPFQHLLDPSEEQFDYFSTRSILCDYYLN